MARYTDETLRGMLLEEAILLILSRTAYSPIFSKNGDESLNDGTSGLEVVGRGANHQIDAIADSLYTPPFCNQQRLLIEAKFRGKKTGIDVVRNATGVYKDVSEHWVSNGRGARSTLKKRYHYLYAIFSKEPFSKPAQNYAYAQDIFLLPLKRNSLFGPIIDAIDSVSFSNTENRPSLSSVRKYVRNRFFPQINLDIEEDRIDLSMALLESELSNFVQVSRQRGYGFITMLNGKFPVFLSTDREIDLQSFNETNDVRIRVIDNEWYIESIVGDRLFTFDLPEEIFAKYEEGGFLSPRKLYNIKQRYMTEFYVFVTQDGDLKLIKFQMDQSWFQRVRQNLRNH